MIHDDDMSMDGGLSGGDRRMEGGFPFFLYPPLVVYSLIHSLQFNFC